MSVFELAALLVVMTALFAYANHRLFRLPTTIGVMLIAVIFSLGIVLVDQMGTGVEGYAHDLLAQIDFDRTLLDGMLSFLLFAGALHVDLNRLAEQKWVIAVLASLGLVASTTLVGVMAWLVFHALGLPVPFIYCLLFGALISPTDPVAVLGILKKARVPQSVETKVTGESLFNDGVAVVIFVVLAELATGAHTSASHVATLFIQEAAGGALFGMVIGYVAYQMLKGIDNYQVEILLTLAVVMGGYTTAHALHLSGPIAMVVAGLLIGNHGRRLAMSDRTRDHLDTFWELTDELLNAILFVIIGFEIILVPFTPSYWAAALLAIPVVLLGRFLSVGAVVSALRSARRFTPHAVKLLTWAGLRGGISIALVLSLPPGTPRDVLLTATYGVVLFAILVQGLTIGRAVRAWLGTRP